MMSLQQFRVLLAVKEHGSLTGAAEALRYGVPTVKHHLRTLESHLQAEIVESGRSGTALTPLGESFLTEIAPVLERIERAERTIAAQRDAGVVTLRIGTFASIGSRLLPAAIAQLQDRHSVRVEVFEAEPSEVVRMLRADEVHAGLIYDVSDAPAFDAPDLALSPLLAEPFRVLVAKESAWASRAQLDFADLADTPWVFSRSDDGASDRVLRRVYRSIGREAVPLMRTDDLYMIHGLVAKGLCLALSTEAAVDTDFDVVLRPAVQDLGERQVSFVTRRQSRIQAAAWLRGILRDEARALGS